MTSRAETLIKLLHLRPHPEGGHYAEVYRSGTRVRCPPRDRAAVTTIYYLLAAGDISRWHVVQSDEIWHLYEGDGLELIDYDPDRRQVRRVRLGPSSDDAQPVHVVPAGHWQAVRPIGEHALAGCTVAPGFEFEDFRFVADLAGHETAFAGPLAEYRAML